MSTHQPAITVLMPAYNAGKYIGEAITSILAQTFDDFEFLIIDDGSTDNTAAIVHSFDDKRIQYHFQKKQGGVANALNYGLQLAKAPLIARFDADDICYPGRLMTQYQFLKAHPQYHIIGSAVDYADESGKFIFRYQAPVVQTGCKVALPVCPFIHSSVMYLKESVLAMGGYPKHAHLFEDHMLWQHMLEQYKGFNLDESLIKVRLNPGSVTMDEKWQHPQVLKIKYTALQNRFISAEDGEKLLNLIQLQQERQVHYKAYYGLLAKKYLWNNHNPQQARYHLFKLLSYNKFSLKTYSLLLLSFLPSNLIQTIYQRIKLTSQPL